jgi:hypothetical protein
LTRAGNGEQDDEDDVDPADDKDPDELFKSNNLPTSLSPNKKKLFSDNPLYQAFGVNLTFKDVLEEENN